MEDHLTFSALISEDDLFRVGSIFIFCGPFNGLVNNSGYIASNGRVVSE